MFCVFLPPAPNCRVWFCTISTHVVDCRVRREPSVRVRPLATPLRMIVLTPFIQKSGSYSATPNPFVEAAFSVRPVTGRGVRIAILLSPIQMTTWLMEWAFGCRELRMPAEALLRTRFYANNGRVTQTMAELRKQWQSYANNGRVTQTMAELRKKWKKYENNGKIE